MPPRSNPDLAQMRRRTATARRFPIRLRWLVVACFLLWTGYEYCFVERPLLAADAVARVRVAAAIRQESGQVHSLRKEIRALHTYRYIATLAAERYNLVKPGEILFASSGS